MNGWIAGLWGVSFLSSCGIVFCFVKGLQSKEAGTFRFSFFNFLGQCMAGLLIWVGFNAIPWLLSYFIAEAIDANEIASGLIAIMPLVIGLPIVNIVMLIFLAEAYTKKNWGKAAGLSLPFSGILFFMGLLVFWNLPT